jgi:uncharacterized protein
VNSRDDLLTGQPFADVAETHSAVVYFCGERAYKLKKPVRLAFLDFTTVESRERACERETELNRRFAPDVYLGVAEVRNPVGEVCDHLVVMRRMPARRRLSALIKAGEPVDAAVRQVARQVAAQHAGATRGPEITAQMGQAVTATRWRDNLEQLRADGAGVIISDEADEIGRLADRFLGGRAALLETRRQAGRAVDGHGDLLAGDIFCLEDGPRLLDCLDFDDRLRWVDGLDDAAFLAMDLESLGAPGLAQRFMNWYCEFSGDHAPASLHHHYVAYRAVVRAKVSCLRAVQGDPDGAGQARHLTAMALRHLRAGAVTLVLVGGLPGTGKSALAATIGSQTGFPVLSSDQVRKEIGGFRPGEAAGAAFRSGLYSPEWTERTYGELLRRAGSLLGAGESVLVDATWSAADHRDRAARLAAELSADLVQLQCSVPEDLAARRIAARTGGASDATPELAARIAAEADAWPEAVVIDTSGADARDSAQPGPAETALGVIRPHGHEYVWRPVRSYMLPG